jgi:hypothetical protein
MKNNSCLALAISKTLFMNMVLWVTFCEDDIFPFYLFNILWPEQRFLISSGLEFFYSKISMERILKQQKWIASEPYSNFDLSNHITPLRASSKIESFKCSFAWIWLWFFLHQYSLCRNKDGESHSVCLIRRNFSLKRCLCIRIDLLSINSMCRR